MKELPTEGRFRCEQCGQVYEVPETTVTVIRGHLKRSHGVSRDSRWVRRRLKPLGEAARLLTIDEPITEPVTEPITEPTDEPTGVSE